MVQSSGPAAPAACERDVLVSHPSPCVFVNVNFFYAFGNTPPSHLLKDLPRGRASLLLLGCGDLRDLLYTLACEAR
jgi:hypothetical protein